MFASVLWLFMCLLCFTHDNHFNYLLFFQNGGQNGDKLKFTTFQVILYENEIIFLMRSVLRTIVYTNHTIAGSAVK